MSQLIDEQWMKEALKEAGIAYGLGEVPIGAVLVRDDQMLASAHNLRETAHDPTAHAEVLVLRKAAEKLGHWRLTGTTLYVTLEPCPMCAGALVNARISRLVFGAFDPKAGAAGSLLDLLRDERLNHRLAVDGGVLAEECGGLLRKFFAERR
ncbi:MAG TPA: tRNA adenosine(34) deaminase TadA [Bacillota bacterium]|nr:tRNA adenosine(34) deaminase TadA [Bacillota bacterium]